MPELIDQCGRKITRLRLAVTGDCNFNCFYCRPQRKKDDTEVYGSPLSVEEIVQIAEAAVACGVERIRLTGGEPLLRRDLCEILQRIAELKPTLDISLTTNGHLLAEQAEPLFQAGLKRVNVSLDSLQGERFCAITGSHSMATVLAGLGAASRIGLAPVKVNVVVVRGLNDDEIPKMVRFAAEHGYHIRFIEFMPLDGKREWRPEMTVPMKEVRTRIEQEFVLTPLVTSDSPGNDYLLGAGPARVSLICPISNPFCDRCNRIRVTADGFLRLCLFSTGELDLRPALASADPGKALIELFVNAISHKPRCHHVGEEDFPRPSRPMSAIGG